MSGPGFNGTSDSVVVCQDVRAIPRICLNSYDGDFERIVRRNSDRLIMLNLEAF